MNTWRDIKTDPPQINWPVNPVFVTDGKNVYFGRLMWDPDVLFFRGCSLQRGDCIFVPASELTEWQPAPDTWKPEKTADEMFRELGYLWEGTPENGREYECVDYNDVVTVTTSDVDFHGTDGGYRFVVPAKLVLACAQLIREMEADNGRY